MSFTIGSLFDGSGGFPLAATMCGGTPKWAAEVEPYPIAVTKSRFPDMKHLGSVTDVKGCEVEPVDVLTFGAPCQDLSVAGLRKGIRHDSLGDEETTRSGLFMEAVRIIKEMREHLFENHSQDSRYRGPLDVSPMLPAQLGTGGNNQPFVVESKVYESHPMDSRIKELDSVSPTVSVKWHKGAADTPLVCEGTPIHAAVYSIGNGQVAQLGLHDKARTLDCMHDQQAICYVDTTHADDVVRVDDVTAPLQERDYKGGKLVTYGVDCRNATEYPEITGALQADSAHNLNSNNVVRIMYIVRRLTPTECARLQGFPDNWGHPDVKTELTDGEYQFWLNVRNTHAAINDKPTKDYTKEQILKWYNGLHTDSSEYKMWGNGIALPNALYIMQGIADVMSEEKAARRKWLSDLLGGGL